MPTDAPYVTELCWFTNTELPKRGICVDCSSALNVVFFEGWGDSSVQCLACTDETRVQVLAAWLNDGVEAGVSNTRDGEA